MILRLLAFSRFAALLVAGLGFSAAPASACGFFGGCWAPAPVTVQYYQPSCGCCGCGGASYYSSYLPAYGYPPYGSVYGGGCGYGCGGGFGYGGFGYGAGFGAAAYVAPPVGPYIGPRPWGPRPYWGPRRVWARY